VHEGFSVRRRPASMKTLSSGVPVRRAISRDIRRTQFLGIDAVSLCGHPTMASARPLRTRSIAAPTYRRSRGRCRLDIAGLEAREGQGVDGIDEDPPRSDAASVMGADGCSSIFGIVSDDVFVPHQDHTQSGRSGQGGRRLDAISGPIPFGSPIVNAIVLPASLIAAAPAACRSGSCRTRRCVREFLTSDI